MDEEAGQRGGLEDGRSRSILENGEVEVVFFTPSKTDSFSVNKPELKVGSFSSTSTASTAQLSVLREDDVISMPGSPWARPLIRKKRSSHRNNMNHRPSKPLPLASYASIMGLTTALAWSLYLLFVATWYYSSVVNLIVQFFLTFLTFFGVFWNTYFTASAICKCFIPKKSFHENGKYLSLIPEEKHQGDEWLPVTIQIPVYKESLAEVIGPTLLSSIEAREHYKENTGADCNIVVCDDGIMPFLGDSMIIAQALWQLVNKQHGGRGVESIQSVGEELAGEFNAEAGGLKEEDINEVYDRMLFYFHHNIGFVARSAHNRAGKFKKASNLNSHLRLYFGAQQMVEETSLGYDEALCQAAHDEEGDCIMFYGNNVSIGSIIIINDSDARMSPDVILKTIPEFLNDETLGFTQHTTKVMDDQRDASHYLKLLGVYTDALYQGHFMLSSMMGCHPPLVGHSVMIRTEAIRQCGRIRSIRKAQRWLKNIGLHFLEVSSVGHQNLHSAATIEYWSENHVSEDFELMIHFYNMGYEGRYVAYPDCEFQEGVTRTFDEEAARHRKFSMGAHELIFNSFHDICGHGIFTASFRTFLTSDIPTYYKIYLAAYLLSYVAGGIYIFVFGVSAILKVTGFNDAGIIFATTPAAVLLLNIIVYYVIGYSAFLVALTRMFRANKELFFPEYRDKSTCSLVGVMVRYAMGFQASFYTVMGNYFFLGGMDHMLNRDRPVGATNKDKICHSRREAIKELVKFNSDSWAIGLVLICLGGIAFAFEKGAVNVGSFLFAGPVIFIGIVSIISPFLLNPYVIGNRSGTVKKEQEANQIRSESTFDDHELSLSRSCTTFAVGTASASVTATDSIVTMYSIEKEQVYLM